MRPLSSRDLLGAPLRRLHARRGGTCVVLAYHRVIDTPTDPQLQNISPARFAEQMAVLAARYTPIPAGLLVEHIEAHRPLPPRAVVVTLDDGYANNLRNALPVLRAHGVPATVFVASGLVGSERLTWIDELEELVLRPAELPSTLALPVSNGRRTFELPAGSYGAPDPAWSAAAPAVDARTATYVALADTLLRFSPAERARALASLRNQIGLDPMADEGRRMLSAAELRTLADNDLITVGAHTDRHARLASLPPGQQEQEIVGGVAELGRVLGRTVELFAYPYGGATDYTERTVALVRRAGIRAAFTTRYGVATPWSDRWRLPRVSAARHTGAALAAALDAAVASGK